MLEAADGVSADGVSKNGEVSLSESAGVVA
jgi:hypothetical protein